VLEFQPKEHLVFDYGPNLPGHANGMIIKGVDAQGDVITQVTYYSVGGGFILTEEELAAGKDHDDGPPVPFPFKSAKEMLDMAAESGLTVADMKRKNELSRRKGADLDAGIARIWEVMNTCINRGLENDGILPGGLKVKRRAKGIHQSLLAERGMNLSAPHTINDWMSTYAMAVNEENAAGGQVVTAPTSGAAGVIPATIRYWLDHVPGATVSKVPDFLLTAAAIGGLIKFNASISGAECGCQAEVGSASAMAAAIFSARSAISGANRAGTIERSRMWFSWMFSEQGKGTTSPFSPRAQTTDSSASNGIHFSKTPRGAPKRCQSSVASAGPEIFNCPLPS